MTIKEFIREHRKEIDSVINERCCNKENTKHNDNERYEWILNDTCLYGFARSYGCRI